jgi:hypothetical protein
MILEVLFWLLEALFCHHKDNLQNLTNLRKQHPSTFSSQNICIALHAAHFLIANAFLKFAVISKLDL